MKSKNDGLKPVRKIQEKSFLWRMVLKIHSEIAVV